ncbi:MAG: TIGR03619 family F420-dependent LLM class oxidoreductase [Actinobacteria bacterium]|nr:TIGR03619 family F420-dependent LLM class oxidoreductase [Actinomycetota bacterium]
MRRVGPGVLLSLPVGTHRHGDDPRALVDLSRRAEGAGVDGVVLADHVLLGKHVDRYPWGRFPFPSDAPWLEPLTVLTAIAVATEHLRLTTGILIVPLRPAPLLAKTVATLDVLSSGRVELGVGTGWQAEELVAQGIDPARRGQVLTDHMAACRALWSNSPASFHSESVSFEDVWSEPKPVRPGGPPVLFSGTLTKRNLDRIVTLGDGWIPIMGETLDGIATGVETLRAAYGTAGRAPDELRVRAPLPIVRGDDGAPSVTATMNGMGALAGVGVTDVYLTYTAFTSDDESSDRFFDELTERLGGRG